MFLSATSPTSWFHIWQLSQSFHKGKEIKPWQFFQKIDVWFIWDGELLGLEVKE